MKFWYINGSGVRRSNLVPGLGLPFFRSRNMWSFLPYPPFGRPSLRIYNPWRRGGPGTGDLGSRSSRNYKNCESVKGSI